MQNLKILILGGTVFLGRHLTEALLSRGHEVTLYNRGQQNPHLFPAIEKLRGDRDRDISLLNGRSWDAVVDTCGYFPRQVAASAKTLNPHTPLYVYISSVNQYADLSVCGVDESHPGAKSIFLAEQPDPLLTAESYGPLKAACEEVVRRVYGDGALVVRPGCLVGPYDQAHRFSYWVRRAAAGGAMLVPGGAEQLWQIIDVRDVAEWIVRMLEVGQTGTFNAVGPERPISASRLMQELAAATASDLQPAWVDVQFLRTAANGRRWLDLAEWSDLPPSTAHLYSIDNTHALGAGLSFRPLADTMRDVLAWLAMQPLRDADALMPDTEKELLRAWKCCAAPTPC